MHTNTKARTFFFFRLPIIILNVDLVVRVLGFVNGPADIPTKKYHYSCKKFSATSSRRLQERDVVKKLNKGFPTNGSNNTHSFITNPYCLSRYQN
jgi:hypothetical protein